MQNENKLAGLGLAIVAIAVAAWGVSTLRAPDLSVVAQEHDSGGARASSTVPTVTVRQRDAVSPRDIPQPTNSSASLFSFYASNDSRESVRINSVSVAVSSTPNAIINYRLMQEDGRQLGGVVGKAHADAGGSRYQVVTFSGFDFTLAPGASYAFAVNAQFNSLRRGAVSNTRHRLLIPPEWRPDGHATIVGTGLTTRLAANINGTATGNSFVIYAAVVSAGPNAGTPSGAAVPAAEQTVAIFDVWASTPRERVPTLSWVNLGFEGVVNETPRAVKVYYEEVGRRRVRIGSVTVPAGIMNSVSVSLGNRKIYATPARHGKLIVTFDSRGMAPGARVRTTLDPLIYSDTITRSIFVQGTPLAAGELVY